MKGRRCFYALFFLLLQIPPETPLSSSFFFFFFFAGNKVTRFSKGCLIRQSAAVAGPRGCCQARLCTAASSGEIYPVCFGTVANMFLFPSRYAPSLPRKKNIFTEGEEARRWARAGLPGRIFHRQTAHNTHFICSALKALPHLYLCEHWFIQ